MDNVGMKRAKTKQYTIRGVPIEVDRALRKAAKSESKSLNQVALEALLRAAGLSPDGVVFHDLDWLKGTWVEDPAFDEAIADQRKIDEDMWR